MENADDYAGLISFLENARQEDADIIRRLHSIILSVDKRFRSSIKWKMLTYAINGDFHHWICAVSITKKNIGLAFHFGGLLDDEKHLLVKGGSKFFRKIEIDSLHKIDEAAIKELLLQAIDNLPYFIEHWREIQGGIS